MINWIDNASYTALLRAWRFTEGGHAMFQGEIGAHFTNVMQRHEAQMTPAEKTAASKAVRWKRG
jgi:hypothetical protein